MRSQYPCTSGYFDTSSVGMNFSFIFEFSYMFDIFSRKFSLSLKNSKIRYCSGDYTPEFLNFFYPRKMEEIFFSVRISTSASLVRQYLCSYYTRFLFRTLGHKNVTVTGQMYCSTHCCRRENIVKL